MTIQLQLINNNFKKIGTSFKKDLIVVTKQNKTKYDS